MDYQLFKLMCEMSHMDTFGKDKKIRQLYKRYLWEKKYNENNTTDNRSRPRFPSKD